VDCRTTERCGSIPVAIKMDQSGALVQVGGLVVDGDRVQVDDAEERRPQLLVVGTAGKPRCSCDVLGAVAWMPERCAWETIIQATWPALRGDLGVLGYPCPNSDTARLGPALLVMIPATRNCPSRPDVVVLSPRAVEVEAQRRRRLSYEMAVAVPLARAYNAGGC